LTDRAGASAPGAGPDRPPSKSEVLDQVQAEAAEIGAERKQLAELKERARDEVDAESQAKVEDQRIEFRRQLSQLVQSGKKQAGKDIDELCDQFGRVYSPELRAEVTHELKRFQGRLTREAKVRLLREFGVPEAAILDFLANEVDRYYRNSRNGPRDEDEVRLSAARLLLSFKVAKAPRGLPPRVGPGRAPVPGRARGNAPSPGAR
jgi:hypothetical protein